MRRDIIIALAVTVLGIGLSLPASAQGANGPTPKTWPAVQCLLGMGAEGCEKLLAQPVTITHCAQQHAHERLDNCRYPLSVVLYLGTNASGADVYDVVDRHVTETFTVSMPSADGKVPQYCIFGVAAPYQAVCNKGPGVQSSALEVTSPAKPPVGLWHNPQ